MDGDFGNHLARYIICFFLLWVFFAIVVGASIATAICWWLW
jgi:hypothetical protein